MNPIKSLVLKHLATSFILYKKTTGSQLTFNDYCDGYSMCLQNDYNDIADVIAYATADIHFEKAKKKRNKRK